MNVESRKGSSDTGLEITPWVQAFKNLLYGILLCTITINVLYLQFILPSIGVVLVFLGMRMMRRNNSWFLLGYICSGLYLARWFIHLLILATLKYQNDVVAKGMGIISVGLYFFLTLALYFAVRRELIKIGKESKSIIVLWLPIFYVILTVISYIGLGGSFIFVFILILILVKIVYGIKELFLKMEEWGFKLNVVPIKIKNGQLFIFLSVGMILGVLVGSISTYCDFTKGIELSNEITDSQKNFQETIIDMGVPEEIAMDLQETDSKKIVDAVHCICSTETVAIENNSIEVTNIFFYMKNKEIYAVTYFKYLSPSKIYLTDIINLEMGYRLTPLSGKIFYELNQKDYVKNIRELKNIPSNSKQIDENAFFPTDTSNYLYAIFNYPWSSQNQRGYVLSFFDSSEGYASSLISSYYRRKNLFLLTEKPLTNLYGYETCSVGVNFEPIH